MISRGKAGLQERPVKKTGWTKARRTAFLEMLATTCNVGRSAKAAGMTASTAYRLRNRDGGFAQLWAAAVAAGSERLKERLLAHSLGQAPDGENPDALADEPVATPFDVDVAMATLKTLAAIDRRGSGGGERPTYATDAEVTVMLVERLDALASRLARP